MYIFSLHPTLNWNPHWSVFDFLRFCSFRKFQKTMMTLSFGVFAPQSGHRVVTVCCVYAHGLVRISGRPWRGALVHSPEKTFWVLSNFPATFRPFPMPQGFCGPKKWILHRNLRRRSTTTLFLRSIWKKFWSILKNFQNLKNIFLDFSNFPNF